jgi:hypothetical protein
MRYCFVVSATEIIEQIKQLPPDEQAQVAEFVQSLQSQPGQVRYMDEKTFKAAADRVQEKYDDVLRRLAK